MSINWASIIAWGLAIGVSVISPETGLLSIAPLNSIISAVVFYYVADVAINRNKVSLSVLPEQSNV